MIEKREGEIVVPEKPLMEGKALVKTGTPYITAVFVQKPRDLDKIDEAVKRECQFGGGSFFYGWTLKRGKSAGKRIEGGSIGLATSLARIWGNVAIPVTVQETEDMWLFTASFIDLETGFNIQRVFRYDRTFELPGEYDSARKEDMKFQIGQSKAIRNVILNGGIPKWLVDGAVRLAKLAVVKEITKHGLAISTKHIIEFFAEHNITVKMLVGYIDQPRASWTAETIAHLQGIQQSILDKQVSPEEIRADMMEKQEEEPVSVEKILNGKNKESKPAKTEAKKKEPAGKKKAKTFPCENPKCQLEVSDEEARYSEQEFNGAIFCTDCQVLARSGKLAIPK